MTASDATSLFCVLIPAYNEADRVGDTVRSAKLLPGVGGVIVIDDGSSDATSDAASAAGATDVIRFASNRGKGAALNAGLSRTSSDTILILDADLGATASSADLLVAEVTHNNADMAVAVFPELVTKSKPQGRSGGFGLALRLSKWGIRRLTGASLLAPLSGQRAIRRDLVDSMGGFFPGFGVETALSGWAAAGGHKVAEVPLPMSHRRTGKNVAGVLHRARQLAHIARALVWLAANRSRARRPR